MRVGEANTPGIHREDEHAPGGHAAPKHAGAPARSGAGSTPPVQVVIPVNNQAAAIGQVVAGLARQTLVPDRVVFVFDRCVDDSRQVVERAAAGLPRRVQVDLLDSGEHGEGFLAGRVRDTGLAHCSRDGDGLSILLDGDSVPTPRLVETHVTVLRRTEMPAASCGLMLRGGSADGAHGTDGRSMYFGTRIRQVLFPGLIRSSFATRTCNLGLNQAALDMLRRVNRLLSGESRVFNPEFDSAWGVEDDFLGTVLFKIGGELFFLGQHGHSVHVDHPPRSTARTVGRQFQVQAKLTERLEALILTGQVPGEVTRISRMTCAAGKDSLLEDLNFTCVRASPPTEAWLERTGLVPRLQQGLRLPEELAAPLVKIMFARTKRWTRHSRCRCHDLMRRERTHGPAVTRLRQWMMHWVGPTLED
jgi:Glycosyl transferase family 2